MAVEPRVDPLAVAVVPAEKPLEAAPPVEGRELILPARDRAEARFQLAQLHGRVVRASQDVLIKQKFIK